MAAVSKLLEREDVAEYLLRPHKVELWPLPLTGGSSKDGKVYYVDPDVPKDMRRFVIWHERVEKALREVCGMKYPEAHTYATEAEKTAVEAAGESWEEYKKRVARPVRWNEKHRRTALPAGFDYGPMRQS